MTADDIKALLQRLRHYGDNDRDAACALIEKLQSELKARQQRQHDAEALAGEYLIQRDDARTDAARYRWLRSRVFKDGGDLGVQVAGAYDGFVGGSMAEGFDAAVDAARKEQS